ncbi:hypothetical protein PYW07_001371 [Mythimna separata]|uniref:Uncharacterized protein n=1 Tax=Mythimna separata TaxID=271217 RepID=A0AAD7YUW3_MYTSE|nr:hypothetical protein PYW07_001371 [Mythimna separata]
MAEESKNNETYQNEEFEPRVRWCNPHVLELMTFVGKDIFAIAHDIYIIFFNYKTSTETVYVANSLERGDGVDALAGHRTHMFAFAEKVQNARIFVVMYPSFNILAELKEVDAKRFKAICMMECDLIAGLTGFPTYLVTVWCWRTSQRLYHVETGVKQRRQLFM